MTLDKLIEEDVWGRAKFFNITYGFIVNPQYGDVFVHYSNIDMDGFKKLDEGQEVMYDLWKKSDVEEYYARKVRLHGK